MNIIYVEKIRVWTKDVEKTYVNQNAYKNRKTYLDPCLWKNLWKVWKTHIYQQLSQSYTQQLLTGTGV